MKKVLILTYYWPPGGGAGVQRWLKFVKYLREFGWEPIVYTAKNGEMPVIDQSLEQDIPKGITVIKTKIWEPYSFYKTFIGKKQNEKINASFLSEKKKPSITEIAAIIDIPEGTVKSKLFYLMKKLSLKLKVYSPHFQ